MYLQSVHCSIAMLVYQSVFGGLLSPIWKLCASQIGFHFPKAKFQKYLKPPPAMGLPTTLIFRDCSPAIFSDICRRSVGAHFAFKHNNAWRKCYCNSDGMSHEMNRNRFMGDSMPELCFESLIWHNRHKWWAHLRATSDDFFCLGRNVGAACH